MMMMPIGLSALCNGAIALMKRHVKVNTRGNGRQPGYRIPKFRICSGWFSECR
jgi:hypothetical protein